MTLSLFLFASAGSGLFIADLPATSMHSRYIAAYMPSTVHTPIYLLPCVLYTPPELLSVISNCFLMYTLTFSTLLSLPSTNFS